MGLNAQLDTDFKNALKSKDAEKLLVLRMVRSNIKNLEIEKLAPASDEDVVEILQREVKQHKESIDANIKADRKAEVKRLETEVDLLKTYLPTDLTSIELKDEIERAISETKASSVSDLGKVMGNVMAKVKGRASGDEVGQIVRDLLSTK